MDTNIDVDQLEELTEDYGNAAALSDRRKIEQQILDVVLGEVRRDEDFAVYTREQWKAITDAIETDDESLKALLRGPSFGYLEEDDDKWNDERFAVLTEEEYERISNAVDTDDERVKSLLRLPYLDRLP